jgi:hypothetical protein
MSIARIFMPLSVRLAAMAALSTACLTARADIYECIDANGNKRFTNIAAEAKGCKPLNIQLAPAAPPPAPASAAPPSATAGKASPARPSAAPTPAGFPRVDRETQAGRDNDRRRILENELANEQKALDDAKRDLAAQESQRLGDERNYQRVLDRLEPYKKKVKQHEDNVAAIRREIGSVR